MRRQPPQLRRPRSARLGRLAAILICAGASLSGCCNLIGVAAGKLLPAPRQEAAFDLEGRPASVVVTSDPAVAGEWAAIDADTLAMALEQALERHTTSPVVPPGQAQTTIRVELNPPAAEVDIAGEVHRGQASAWVRVEDLQGQPLWPGGGTEGRLIEVQTPRVRSADPAEVRRATLRALGEKVAALFYSREMRPDE